MQEAMFSSRLSSGKSCHFLYAHGEFVGKISVWKYEGSFILTWEECPEGQIYDESTYTRDDRYQFGDIDAVLAFLAEHDLSVERFTP